MELRANDTKIKEFLRNEDLFKLLVLKKQKHSSRVQN